MNIYFKSLLLASVFTLPLQAELIKTYFKYGELKAETNYEEETYSDISPGVKQGIQKVYYEMGALAYTVNYADNKRDGKLTWYDKEGVKLADIFYKDGKMEGVEKSYFPNGKIKHQVTYKNDMKEGLQQEFFENGKVALEVNYTHNKKEGLQKEYTQNGKLYTKVMYKNNYKEGTQEWYDEKGNVLNSIFYKMDRPIDIMKKVQTKKEEPNVLINSVDFSPQKPE